MGPRIRTSPSAYSRSGAPVASGAIGASVIRLVGMILAEQDDEWQDGRCYFRPETMTAIDAVATSAVASLVPGQETMVVVGGMMDLSAMDLTGI